MRNTILNLRQFFIKPSDTKISEGFMQMLKTFLHIFIIDIILMLVFIMIFQKLQQFELINVDSHSINKMFSKYSLVKFFATVVIIIPFIEEIIFRYHLNFSKNFYFIQPLLLISLILGKDVRNIVEQKLKQFWQRYFVIIFYASTLIFAILHMSNYTISFKLLLFSPLLVMPQFIVGFFCGYLRVKFNLLTGYFLHMFHNAFFVLTFIITTGKT